MQIKRLSGVTAADKILTAPAMLAHGDDKHVQARINIVDPRTFGQTLDVANRIANGTFLANDDEIVLGRRLLEKGALEGVKVGDRITMNINSKKVAVKVGGIASTKFYNVDIQAYISRGLWHKIVSEVTSNVAVAENTATKNPPLSEAIRLLPPAVAAQLNQTLSAQTELLRQQQRMTAAQFAGKDDASMIVVRTDPDKENSVRQAITDLNYPGLRVHEWRDGATVTDTIAGSFQSLNAIMLAVGIIIAAVTIFIVIYVDIINKRRQIGIQRALGVKPRVIVFSYVLLALFYAVCGVGAGLAIFFGGLVPYVMAHPFSLPVADVTLNVSWADLLIRAEIVLLVAIVSGAIPAIMASRMKMLEAILGKG